MHPNFLLSIKINGKAQDNWFLPTYSETILEEIENSPDMLFEAMSKTQSILKQLRREKIMPIAEDIIEEPFGDLKIIYHGSETDLRDKNGVTYPKETILRGSVAYNFLCSLKSGEVSKIWLEIFYKNYAHGKILLADEDFEFSDDESVSAFLKKRLNQNRQYLLDNPQELRQYITDGKNIRVEELLSQVQFESEHFLSVMTDFTQEEISYLENHNEF